MDWLGQETSNRRARKLQRMEPKERWVVGRTILGHFIFGALLVGGLAMGAAAQEKQEAEAYSGVAVRKARSMRWKV